MAVQPLSSPPPSNAQLVGQQLAAIIEQQAAASQPLAPDDPVEFAEDCGIFLWSMQQRIAHAVMEYDRVTVASCNSSGKTFLFADLALWWVLRWPRGDAQVVVTGPNYSAITEGVMEEARKIHATNDLPGRFGIQKLYLDGPNDSEVLAITGRALAQTDRGGSGARGKHAKHLLVLVEEADGLTKSDMEVIESWAAGGDAHVCMISNPRKKRSPFGEAMKPGSGWHAIWIGYEDCPAWTGESVPSHVASVLIQPAYVERVRKSDGEGSSRFAWSCQGKFPQHGDESYIGDDLVEAAVARDIPPDGRIVLGLDPGGGGDPSSLWKRQGMHARPVDLQSRNNPDADTVSREVMRKATELGASEIRVDDFGVGAEHAAKLSASAKGTGIRIIGVNMGRAVPPAVQGKVKVRFKNQRARCCWQLRQELLRGELDLPEHDKLADDIAELRALPPTLKNSPLQFERKELMKQRLGRSPDDLDALILTGPVSDKRIKKRAIQVWRR